MYKTSFLVRGVAYCGILLLSQSACSDLVHDKLEVKLEVIH